MRTTVLKIQNVTDMKNPFISAFENVKNEYVAIALIMSMKGGKLPNHRRIKSKPAEIFGTAIRWEYQPTRCI
jgi:hypothetical protein